MSGRAILGEEARARLRQVAERQAYRQLVAADIRGAGLRFLPQLSDKMRLVRELELSLRVLADLERIHQDLGGGDLYLAVRERMELIPYPASRMELAACLALTPRAERAAARSWADCAHPGFARVAAALLEARYEASEVEERLFVEFAGEEPQRPQAQAFWSRWLAISLRSLGRPGTKGDLRAVELGLRSKRAAEVIADFLDEVEPLRARARLEWPPLAELGVDLPPELRARLGAGA